MGYTSLSDNCSVSALLTGQDSGAHQIVWAALGDVDQAVADLRTMLKVQLDDGRIPQQINWEKKSSWDDTFRDPLRLYSRTDYNDLTQTPVLAYSLRSIYNATGDITYLEEFVPKLIQLLTWWKKTRDLDGTGVVTILHPWESGIDLSPAYDAALGVSPSNRARPPWRAIYPQLIQLALSYRWRFGWDQKKILARSHPAAGPFNWFKVQDIAVNCVYASAWRVLGDLASCYNGEIAAECYAQQKHSEAGILNTLFDESAGHFVTGYKNKDNVQSFHNVKVVQMLFPLLLDSISPEQVQGIVNYLTDENEFATNYPIPSVSKAEAEYNPIQNTDLLWRGPTWGFTNWFVMEGLQRHGQTELLHGMMTKWIAMVREGGVYEMYNPETAVGYGAEGLGMSTLIVDWMKRLGYL